MGGGFIRVFSRGLFVEFLWSFGHGGGGEIAEEEIGGGKRREKVRENGGF